jgi:hypothetical protein
LAHPLTIDFGIIMVPTSAVDTGTSAPGPLLVFCSYSHHDYGFREELAAHVSPLVRRNLIKFWSDRRIAPGEQWEQAINEMLDAADIVLLLISAYFVDSDYCYTTELQRALRRHKAGEAKVVPVFVRPCDWEGLDFANLQGLPSSTLPISDHSNRDAAWKEVAEGIKQVAVDIQRERAARQDGGATRGQNGGRFSASLPVPDPQEPKYDSSAYLRSLIAWNRTAYEHTRKIRVQVSVGEDATAVDAIDALMSWRAPHKDRFAILSGAPGSGKTYALRSFAAQLATEYFAGEAGAPPVFVPARQLAAHGNSEGLLSAVREAAGVLADWCEPDAFEAPLSAVPEAAGVLAGMFESGAGVVLIDGLDEPSPGAGPQIFDAIKRLAMVMPESVKFCLSCRPNLRDGLVDALKARGSTPVRMTLRDLSDDLIRQLLNDKHLVAPAIELNLRQPFAVRLIDLLSSESTSKVRHTLDLYERALETTLERIFERTTELAGLDHEDVWMLLIDGVEMMSGSGHIRLDRFRTKKINGPRRIALVNALIAERVLTLDTQEHLYFAHESISEYFYARLLEREMLDWDAAHLSRAHLLYHYNVNRFLVPLLMRAPSHVISDDAANVRAQLFEASSANDGATYSQPVTHAQFQLFMTQTQWRLRQGHGFGRWVPFELPNGIAPTYGQVRFDGARPSGTSQLADMPVSGVSWYDAWQFARWVGCRLPPAAADLPPIPGMLQWTSGWHDEAKALMTLQGDASRGMIAANPDVRSSEIGFRVLSM